MTRFKLTMNCIHPKKSANQSRCVSNPQAATNLIIVMGVAGCGKSTLATALAIHYGYTYLDGDDFHSPEAIDHMSRGIPLTDDMRQPWVGRICEYLQQAAATHQHCVLAFSGLKQAHRNLLRQVGLKTLFLFLHSDKTIIQERIEKRSGHFMDPNLLDSQFDTLETPEAETEYDVSYIEASPSPEVITTESVNIIDRHFSTQAHICNY